MDNNKGFGSFIVLIIIFFVLALGFLGLYQFYNQNNSNLSLNAKEECATPEMFSKDKPQELPNLTPQDFDKFEPNAYFLNPDENNEENKSLFYSKIEYLGVLRLAPLKNEKIFSFRPGFSLPGIIITSELIPGDPGLTYLSHYSLDKANCIKPSYDYKMDDSLLIKSYTFNGLNIYQVPSGIGGNMPEITYFIELPQDKAKIAEAKYIKIEPWYYYDTKKLETVLRSIQIID